MDFKVPLMAVCIFTPGFSVEGASSIDRSHQVLAFYNVAPTQLMLGAWRMILGYEALCVDFAAT